MKCGYLELLWGSDNVLNYRDYNETSRSTRVGTKSKAGVVGNKMVV